MRKMGSQGTAVLTRGDEPEEVTFENIVELCDREKDKNKGVGQAVAKLAQLLGIFC